MKFIKGITFAPFYRKNTLNTEQARESFDYMIENTGADFVILAPGGLQDTAHSGTGRYDLLCKEKRSQSRIKAYREL